VDRTAPRGRLEGTAHGLGLSVFDLGQVGGDFGHRERMLVGRREPFSDRRGSVAGPVARATASTGPVTALRMCGAAPCKFVELALHASNEDGSSDLPGTDPTGHDLKAGRTVALRGVMWVVPDVGESVFARQVDDTTLGDIASLGTSGGTSSWPAHIRPE
jgi:hypothetical protein